MMQDEESFSHASLLFCIDAVLSQLIIQCNYNIINKSSTFIKSVCKYDNW